MVESLTARLRGAKRAAPGVAMSELDDFLTLTLARQIEAEQALVNGDPEPRLAMTSINDPVTVFGAKVPVRRGWDEVSETLRWLAARWSGSTEYRFDLVAADVSGDLAYMIGFEHVANSVVGGRTPCASLTSSAARAVSGRSPTVTPTTSRLTRLSPAKDRRRKRDGRGPLTAGPLMPVVMAP